MTAPTAQQDAWTTRRLLGWMSQTFEQRDLDSPRLCAEILLSHVIGCERLRLYMDPDRPASPAERDTLRDLVKRALAHEPIQYLTGETRFFGLDFTADRRALIPRPSTETIVEFVLQTERAIRRDAPRGRPVRIADVCTGSGCIAIALAHALRQHEPEAKFIATDLSPDALALAQENAERHALADRIDFRAGDLLEPLADADGPFDWILSNPPYIPDHEWDAVEPNVKDHEPHLALRAGPDGLPFVKRLIEGSRALLATDAPARVMIELAACTAAAAADHARAHAWSDPAILKDHEDYDRVLLLKA
jgi:release factor glutamine methyltransferase